MAYVSRQKLFNNLFPAQPAYRWRQIEGALFSPVIKNWSDISNLPKDMREKLSQEINFYSFTPEKVLASKSGDTYKAVVKTFDGNFFETVLMGNKREQWTICVSSQIGCAMGCTFCATGSMKFCRNLEVDEIIDQYRFWRNFLTEKNKGQERISNIVFMGMGEPLENYTNVKEAIKIILGNTDIGHMRVVISTVGVLNRLEEILQDKDWPAVRLAISLHGTNAAERKKIVPSTQPDFFAKLDDWAKRYLKKYGNRRNYLTFEYVLIDGVNDSEKQAKDLADYMKKTGVRKVNLIPYNPVFDKKLQKSQHDKIIKFEKIILNRGLDATLRKTMGDDIAAACGQLVYKK